MRRLAMVDYLAENSVKREIAEQARDLWIFKARKALAAARDCRAKDNAPVDPASKELASVLGREAYAERKAYLAVSAEAASARRVACGIATRQEQEREAKPEPALKPLKPPPRSISDE